MEMNSKNACSGETMPIILAPRKDILVWMQNSNIVIEGNVVNWNAPIRWDANGAAATWNSHREMNLATYYEELLLMQRNSS